MKIAIFHELPPGGARRAINEFANQLNKENVVDLFLVDEKKDPWENVFFSSITFYKFLPKIWRGNNWPVRLYKDTIELAKLCLLNRKIANVIDGKEYDIVLVSASRYIEAPFIMRFLKTPFIFFIHDPFYRIIYDPLLKIPKNLDFIRYNYERFNRFVRKHLDRQNISKAKICLVPSKFIAKLFTKTYGKTCKIVPYGVNTDLFKSAQVKKDIDVFYIGSNDPIDDFVLLEKAIKQMKYKPKLKTLMFEDEWISDDKELVNLYQRSKVLVATARSEGIGAVPLEAMACGLPVVATNEAGHKETVVDGVTGYLLPRNSKVFADKLDWLFSNPSQIINLGKNAREVVLKNWSWSGRSKELIGIIKKYLKK